MKNIVMIEFMTTGYGFRVLEKALEAGDRITLITRDEPLARRLMPPVVARTVDVISTETTSPTSLFACLQALEAQSRIDGLLCMSDKCIDVVAGVAEALSIRFTSAQAVRLARNKPAMRAVARQLALPTPRFAVAKTIESLPQACQAVGFPCIVKPAKGSGSIDVLLCEKPADLRFIQRQLGNSKFPSGEFLVESFVTGPLISVEALVAGGQVTILGITDRVMGELPYFVELAASFPAPVPLATRKQLEQSTRALLEAIHFDMGIAHIEYLLSPDAPVLVEVNPRFPGAFLGPMISAALGVDLYRVYLDLFLGQTPSLPAKPVGAAAGVLLFADWPGRFCRFEGVEKALANPGVLEVVSTAQAGDPLGRPTDLWGLLGSVLAEGSTIEQARKRAVEAATTMSVVYRDEESSREKVAPAVAASWGSK